MPLSSVVWDIHLYVNVNVAVSLSSLLLASVI